MEGLYSSVCHSCSKVALWTGQKMIFPGVVFAVEPHEDMPEDIKGDFVEGSSIAAVSPRGSAALSRLALQKLLRYLGENGENINADIKKFVSGGLNSKIQMALDYVRVTGNNAVHPGQIDTGGEKTAMILLNLLNVITENMITQPKQIKDLFESLPNGAKEQIARRDASSGKIANPKKE